MTEPDLKAVSSATGTFAVLKPQPKSDVETGNRIPDSGKDAPAREKTSQDMEELARALNVASQSIGRDLRFEVDMESGRSVISVLDRDTGEVIRQIPPEKADLYLSGSGAVQIRLYNNKV